MIYLVNTIAMVACGAAGAALGWALVSAFDWTGVGATIVAVVTAMTAATLLWTAGVAIANRLRARR
jgi:bifunctional ADP-heptose synthase (sugar kinase/adenylyltransferase)